MSEKKKRRCKNAAACHSNVVVKTVHVEAILEKRGRKVPHWREEKHHECRTCGSVVSVRPTGGYVERRVLHV